jgi:hypothetical protein
VAFFSVIAGFEVMTIALRMWLKHFVRHATKMKITIPLWQLPIQRINLLGADIADK